MRSQSGALSQDGPSLGAAHRVRRRPHSCTQDALSEVLVFHAGFGVSLVQFAVALGSCLLRAPQNLCGEKSLLFPGGCWACGLAGPAVFGRVPAGSHGQRLPGHLQGPRACSALPLPPPLPPSRPHLPSGIPVSSFQGQDCPVLPSVSERISPGALLMRNPARTQGFEFGLGGGSRVTCLLQLASPGRHWLPGPAPSVRVFLTGFHVGSCRLPSGLRAGRQAGRRGSVADVLGALEDSVPGLGSGRRGSLEEMGWTAMRDSGFPLSQLGVACVDLRPRLSQPRSRASSPGSCTWQLSEPGWRSSGAGGCREGWALRQPLSSTWGWGEQAA